MENTFTNKIIEPYFYSCDGIITDINREFTDFTGFTMDELLGKSLTEIGYILKINLQTFLNDIKSNYSGYIFTKSLYAREVNISLFHDTVTNGQVYTFVEKPNSRLDDKLIFIKQLFTDNKSGFAVYSVPDLILLKSNQKYLTLIDSSFNNEENSIGKPIRNIIKCFMGSESEVVWNSILKTKKSSYIKEIRLYNSNEDVTYWNFTQTTIFENGMMKYIFETATEITERVFEHKSLQRKKKIIEHQKEQLEEQKKQLEAIIENIADGISTFDNKGKYISFNKSERKMFFPYYEYIAQTNNRYYVYIDKTSDTYTQGKLYDINGEKINLENTPICRVMRGEKFKNMRMVVKFPHKTLQLDISGTPIYDSEGKFTLGVLCSRDMSDYFKHEEAIKSQCKFLDRIVDTFDLPVVRISCPDLKIIDINKNAFNIINSLKPDIMSIRQLTQNKIED
ncbi:MAG: transcriptional regulator with PAS, ATPase and Fis domain, partial [Clostridium sp.]